MSAARVDRPLFWHQTHIAILQRCSRPKQETAVCKVRSVAHTEADSAKLLQAPVRHTDALSGGWRWVRLVIRDSNLEPFQSTPPSSPHLGSIRLNAPRVLSGPMRYPNGPIRIAPQLSKCRGRPATAQHRRHITTARTTAVAKIPVGRCSVAKTNLANGKCHDIIDRSFVKSPCSGRGAKGLIS